MQPKVLSIKGVPITDLNIEDLVELILKDVEMYNKEHPRGDISAIEDYPPKFINTMDASIYAKVHQFSWRNVKNPELLSILRSSDFTTTDSLSIVWLSSLLGNKLQERISGVNLVSALAKAIGHQKKSVYLLGNDEETAEYASDHLETQNPGLQVVGLACPKININGANLVEESHRDELLLQAINLAAPDVLFICLDQPIKEIWFERVRHKLRVPIAVGIGNAFELLTEKVRKNSKHKQSNLTSLRPLRQNLWGSAILLLSSIPLVLYHRFNQFAAWLRSGNENKKMEKTLLFFSPNRSIAVIRFPDILKASNCEEISQALEEAFAHDVLILDAKRTKHIDIEAMGLLLNAWTRAKMVNKEFYGFGISLGLMNLFKLHKVWDIISKVVCNEAGDVINRLQHHRQPSSLYESIFQEENQVVLSFLGKLDNTQNYDEYFSKYVSILYKKDCIINFSYCSYIDNSGFIFLLQLKQLVESNGKKLSMTGISRKLSYQFKVSGLQFMLR